MNRTKPIFLFMIVLTIVVLLGTMPAVGQDATGPTSITRAELTGTDGGKITTPLDGQSPTGTPEYCPDGTNCQPMYPADVLKICNGAPTPDNQDNCRTFVSSTLGAAYNTWVLIGGRYRYIAP